MIRLTRLNNQPLMVNSDLIKYVENAPDTLLTLIGGEKIVVRESAETVLQLVIDFRRAVLAGIATSGSDLNTALSALNRSREEKPSMPHSEGQPLG